MVRCTNCGTGWTSQGLPLCPICGTKVPTPAAASKPASDPVPLIEVPAAEPAAAAHKNGSAVMEMPPDLRKAKTEIRPAPQPKPPPVKAEVRIKLPEPSAPPPPEPEVRKPRTAILVPSQPLPVMKKETLVDAEPRLRLLDPSAVDLPAQKALPSPSRPLVGPLVFGALAFVPAVLLPLTAAFESSRVMGVLGFCMAGFFAPFAPIAWMVGLTAEQRRRDQGLRPERAVTLGRTLGQAATMVLVGELTLGLIAVAVLRLSGKFPSSFWNIF